MSKLFVDEIQPKTTGGGISMSGHVVNFKKVTTNTNVVFPNNSTFTTFLSLNYTPLYANSTLLVDVSCSSVSKTTSGAGWIGIRLDLDGVDSGTMGGAFMYQTSANDTRRPFHSRAVIDSWGTTQNTVELKTYGAGTTASWSHQGVQSIMTITEIGA